MLDFPFHTTTLTALPSGGLWWKSERLLCVSDLHLGKSERMARRGGSLLPPYEGAETLDRLQRDVETLRPETVICLGDSFDDLAAQDGLTGAESAQLNRLIAGKRWVWVEGNHDPGPLNLPGTHLAEVSLQGLLFRHIAEAAAQAEISGHFHPKKRVTARGRSITRKCFLMNAHRLILPAYGTYTGGMHVDVPPLSDLVSGGTAILVGEKLYAVPQ